MDRLTGYGEEGCAFLRQQYSAFEAVERLAAYEDTGLTPEQVETLYTLTKSYPSILGAAYKLKDYEKAEAEGRLIVLPCKVGDTIYGIWSPRGAQKVREFTVLSVNLDRDGVCVAAQENHDGKAYYIHQVYFGTTTFLTREAAEAALKEAQG